MHYIGIDPGKDGAVAILNEEELVTLKFDKLTLHEIADHLRELPKETKGVLEKVHSMSNQGVASTFKFGTAYGWCEGLLAALKIPYTYATPQKWQRALSCLTGGDKKISKREAMNRFPNYKVTHADADAILIACYCKQINTREVVK